MNISPMVFAILIYITNDSEFRVVKLNSDSPRVYAEEVADDS